MLDGKEVVKFQRAKRRVFNAVLEHKRSNDGKMPASVTVGLSEYLILKSEGQLDEDDRFSNSGIRVKIGQ